MTFGESTATVQLAAEALGVTPGHIAKTLSFLVDGKALLVVLAGDARMDNRKFKEAFHKKGRMIPAADVESLVGHAPGGVCPFCVKDGVPVYLDTSLHAHETVYPAAGDDRSAVRMTPVPSPFSSCNASSSSASVRIPPCQNISSLSAR